MTVFSGQSEIGQGCDQLLRVIVADELGLDYGAVRVVSGDTDLAPVDLGAYSSRGAFMNGNAALMAARAIKAGTVWLNCHNRLMVEAETGGYRQSGIGRLHGVEGLAPFMETKHIYSQSEVW